MVILNKPKLLLMDEPLNGLDPTSAINMREILLELAAEGTTIIVSSHNLDEIDRLTNTIYFMKDGEILQESLEQFATKEYYVSISDLQKAQHVLAEHHISFETYYDSQIKFMETDVALQTVIDTLNKANIVIEEIESERVGAERRYRELFEGNVHT
ncbi:hypothetical protein RWD45_03830 [Virgibacillus soli]|uniref:Uncharacterized protein n=2 Tax=Paracerasibacillus soli TaxID=480284 RepID=A0ABU5CNG3_9BACI|nr:AAA family ATPase [Virgibacillus soli]MDY0407898.1 hypothetical protein [Virgibacillus soli]